MTIFLILIVIAGVLFIANINTKASPDRSNSLFYGTSDGGAGYADSSASFSDGGAGYADSSASFSDVGFCSDGGGGGDCGGGGCSN